NPGADRLREAEGGGVDRAERRRHHVGAGALRYVRLPRDERGQILIADRIRHQAHDEDAEAEGSVVAGFLRPPTRHTHSNAHATDATGTVRLRTRLNTSVGCWRRSGSNATDCFIVQLTLRSR